MLQIEGCTALNAFCSSSANQHYGDPSNAQTRAVACQMMMTLKNKAEEFSTTTKLTHFQRRFGITKDF